MSLFSAKSSRAVLRHILEQSLQVEVFWVGERMEEVLTKLEKERASYLVLSHTPSTLTSRHSLTPVMFPACRDPLLRRDDTDINCLYAPHRLAKVDYFFSSFFSIIIFSRWSGPPCRTRRRLSTGQLEAIPFHTNHILSLAFGLIKVKFKLLLKRSKF